MKIINKFGRELSSIGFGGASLSGEGGGYGFGEISEKQALELLDYSIAAGVNVFDFAPVYGHGLAEKRAGLGLNRVREKVFIVSKCGVSWHPNMRINMSNEPKLCLKMLEESLKSFKSEYIDLYMIHWPDAKIDIRYCLEALVRAQDQGKINHIGLCNTRPEDLIKAKEVCKIEAVQMEVNLFSQKNFQAMDKELEESVYRMGWGTYDKGILAGSATLSRKFDSKDCRSWAPWWKKGPWKEKVKLTESYMREKGLNKRDMLACSLQFSLSIADTSLCGFKSKNQLDETLRAASAPLADFEELINEFPSL